MTYDEGHLAAMSWGLRSVERPALKFAAGR